MTSNQHQYLTCFPPSLGQDIVSTVGFQRVLTIAHNAASQIDAINRTSTALKDLLNGWGRNSTEWNDLCRVLDFYCKNRIQPLINYNVTKRLIIIITL